MALRIKSIMVMFFGMVSGLFVYMEYTEIAFDITTRSFSLFDNAIISYTILGNF